MPFCRKWLTVLKVFWLSLLALLCLETYHLQISIFWPLFFFCLFSFTSLVILIMFFFFHYYVEEIGKSQQFALFLILMGIVWVFSNLSLFWLRYFEYNSQGFFPPCICMCGYMCVNTYLYTCACICMWRPDSDVACLLYLFSF